MTQFKLVPVEPTLEMILELMSVGLRHAEYVDERGPSVAEMAQGYGFMLAAAPSPWVSVRDELPKAEVRVTESINVIVYLDNDVCTVGFYCHREAVWYSKLAGLVTHWMPLPTPPAQP